MPDARWMFYNTTWASREKQARNAVADLQEAATKAAIRLHGARGSLDRQLLASAARDAMRAAAGLHEAAAALAVLEYIHGAIPAEGEG